MQAQDIFAFRLASQLALSPDGRKLAWVETKADCDGNSYRSHINLTDFATGTTTRLTEGPRDNNPSWSPDGSMMAYVARRTLRMGGRESNASQVYVMRSDGGPSWPVTDLRLGAGAPVWSPDGDRIAFIARVDDRKGPERISDPVDSESDKYLRFNEDVVVVRRRKWKSNGAGFIHNRRSHVVVTGVTSGPGEERTAPRTAIGGDFDVSGFCWDQSGKRMAFIVQPDPEPGKPFERRAELRVKETCAPAAVSRLLCTVARLDGEPAWSPDGKTIAVMGHDSPRSTYAHARLMLIAPDGSNQRWLAMNMDRTLGNDSIADVRTGSGVEGPVWFDGGKSILAQSNDQGTVQVVKIPVDGGPVQWLTQGKHQVITFSASDTGHALLVGDELNPSDIYLADATWGNWRRVTELNREFLATRALSKPERFDFQADDGVTVEGWVMRPVGFQAGVKYPAVLQIHGGPTKHYGYSYFHEFQLLAANGFVVIYCNPRGSQSYSEDFCAAIQGDRGTRDYDDLMQFVEAAVEKYEFIDPDRVGVAGGSYGGFMTNWIISHTGRFRAAVSMRSMFNNSSEFGTGDRGYQREAEAGGGTPWGNPDGYMKTSPVKYIGRCTTPTMVIHSDMDLRCPIDQGEQLYAALFRVGVPCEMVRFPGESHELSRGGKPWHRVFRLNKIVEWFERWLKPPVA